MKKETLLEVATKILKDKNSLEEGVFSAIFASLNAAKEGAKFTVQLEKDVKSLIKKLTDKGSTSEEKISEFSKLVNSSVKAHKDKIYAIYKSDRQYADSYWEGFEESLQDGIEKLRRELL